MKRMVRRPEFMRRSLAMVISRRMSATVEVTPESRTNAASVVNAMSSARLVLPTPGGPKRMIELKLPESTARRNSLPGARICFCPQYSSSERGRIRAASGASSSRAFRRSGPVPMSNSNCSINSSPDGTPPPREAHASHRAPPQFRQSWNKSLDQKRNSFSIRYFYFQSVSGPHPFSRTAPADPVRRGGRHDCP